MIANQSHDFTTKDHNEVILENEQSPKNPKITTFPLDEFNKMLTIYLTTFNETPVVDAPSTAPINDENELEVSNW